MTDIDADGIVKLSSFIYLIVMVKHLHLSLIQNTGQGSIISTGSVDSDGVNTSTALTLNHEPNSSQLRAGTGTSSV